MNKKTLRVVGAMVSALAVTGVGLSVSNAATSSGTSRYIDAGSAAATVGADGRTWEAQHGFFGGGALGASPTITALGGLDPAVAKTSLLSPSDFSMPIKNDTYTVTLYVLESKTTPIWVFSESKQRVTIPQASATDQATVKAVTFTVPVADQNLDLAFAPHQNNDLNLLAMKIASKTKATTNATLAPSTTSTTTKPAAPTTTSTTAVRPTTTTVAPAPTTTTTAAPTTTTTAPAAPSGNYSCVQTAAQGKCNFPADQFITGANENPYLNQNIWAGNSTLKQTLYGASPENWYVMIQANTNFGGVLNYPNVGFNMDGTVDGKSAVTSSWNTSLPHNDKTAAWAAYDLWFNDWADEVMIQTDISANSFYNCDATVSATFGGKPWHMCSFGSERVWKPGTDDQHLANQASGSIDIKEVLVWMEQHGQLPAKSTWTAASYGFEVCDTGGVNEKFAVSGFTFHAS